MGSEYFSYDYVIFKLYSIFLFKLVSTYRKLYMSNHIVSATEASRTLSNILNKVHYQGEHYEIKQGKNIIAQIIPVAYKKASMKVNKLNKFF